MLKNRRKACVATIVCIVFSIRESRRKTPTVVCLKENERLFGDSAMGVVRLLLKFPELT